MPLLLATHSVEPPVVLAPMAGITNLPFRQLCREFGAGVYVCEMVTAAALVEAFGASGRRGSAEPNPRTQRMITFAPGERPRSLQLYSVDPELTTRAVRLVAERDLADHIDLNFGCPVPKVTRKGGGAALPWRRRLFGRIVAAAVRAAAPAGIPVTVKMRTGIDDDHLTYVDAGRIAEEAGAAWVALHGRTAAQRYSGTADWAAVAALKQALRIPVLGNGDIWEADDALRMMARTGADGVVIGRGCLGRPWLFADLAAAFAGRHEGAEVARDSRVLPSLGAVAAVMRRHAELLAGWYGDERQGATDFRKHVAWYLKGFPVGTDLRRALAMVGGLAELDDLLGKLDPTAPFPVATLGRPRGRTNAPGRVHLPEGWLADRDCDAVPAGAELPDSGG